MVSQLRDACYCATELLAEGYRGERSDDIVMDTIAHHIIPLRPAQDPNLHDSTLNFILNFCSLEQEEFNGSTHSLKNIITVNSNIRSHFTRLFAWLDAVPVSTFSFNFHW